MLTFRTEKVNDHITRIIGFATELMYLVKGKERAVLLDTGSGFGGLRKCVEELSDLPVTVLVTHGHVDHAMGCGEFEQVYMSRKDLEVYRLHGTKEFRCNGLPGADMRPLLEEYVETMEETKFRDLQEGDSFDLGGLHVDVFACPGHTPGSLVFLIREDRILLTGDACNTNTFLFDSFSLGTASYEESLKRLKSRVDGLYDTILLSHGPGFGYAGMLEDAIEVCEKIREGEDEKLPFSFLGVEGTKAFANPDFSKANIIYDPKRIEE